MDHGGIEVGFSEQNPFGASSSFTSSSVSEKRHGASLPELKVDVLLHTMPGSCGQLVCAPPMPRSLPARIVVYRFIVKWGIIATAFECGTSAMVSLCLAFSRLFSPRTAVRERRRHEARWESFASRIALDANHFTERP